MVFGRGYPSRGYPSAPPVPAASRGEEKAKLLGPHPLPALSRRTAAQSRDGRAIAPSGGAARRRARGIRLSGILYTCVCVCVRVRGLFVYRICHNYMCVCVCLLRRRRFQWLPPSYCVDVVKSRMQADTVGKYASMLDCAAKVETWSGVERATIP